MSLSAHERRVINQLERQYHDDRRGVAQGLRTAQVARWTAVVLVISLIVQTSLESPGAGLAMTTGLVVIIAAVRIHLSDARRTPPRQRPARPNRTVE